MNEKRSLTHSSQVETCVAMKHTTYLFSHKKSVFFSTDASSLQTDYKRVICEQLNFEFFDTTNTNTTPSKTGTSQKLQQDILKQTGIQTSVIILPVRGDGNCLFRALSLAITGNYCKKLNSLKHLVRTNVAESHN